MKRKSLACTAICAASGAALLALAVATAPNSPAASAPFGISDPGIAAFPDALPLSKKLTKGELARIHGKIQFVESFPDYKVQVVEHFADLHVQKMTAFPDAPGKWQIVESFPDYKIQLVEHFPDFKIKYVTSFPGVK